MYLYIHIYVLICTYIYLLLIKMRTKSNLLYKLQVKSFGHGPYNPLNYKSKSVSTTKLTTEELYYLGKKSKEYGELPSYSMRGVHPIRQSGPIPPFAGPYTMEDIRKTNYYQRMGDPVYESTSAEELMRRVPGLTKKEALHIQTFGLSPWQELDYAYIAVNNGFDIFFNENHGYLARQVVTNSKGEKVECLFPSSEQDEFTYFNYSTHSGMERMDHVWDPVPGEAPICPHPDYELGVPASYFEYEIDNKMHTIMTRDQTFIPEDVRPCPVEKNPNCTSEYWKPQSDLERESKMEDPDWIPETSVNVYNSDKFSGRTKTNFDQNERM